MVSVRVHPKLILFFEISIGFNRSSIGVVALRNGNPFIFSSKEKRVQFNTSTWVKKCNARYYFEMVFSGKALEGIYYEDKGVLTTEQDISSCCDDLQWLICPRVKQN